IAGLAQFTNPNVIDPWGISLGPVGAFWLADEGTGVSTLHAGDGGLPSLGPPVVTVPGLASDLAQLSSPTGTVFNGGPGFVVSQDGSSGPSLFLFATEEGTVAGWNYAVDLTHAITAVDRSATSGTGPI